MMTDCNLLFFFLILYWDTHITYNANRYITVNTNISLIATYISINIHAVIYTTYNTSYLRHLQY